MSSKRRALAAVFFPTSLLLALIFAACSPAPSVVSVTTTLGSSALLIGDTTQADATVVVDGGASQTVTWSSSDTSVATIDNTGLIAGVAEGTTTITATSTADDTKSSSATLSVTHPLTGRSVLYYIDRTDDDAAQAALDAAVAAYGLDLTVATEGDFVSALADEPDLVVYADQSAAGLPVEHRDALLAWIAAGGYATFAHYDVADEDVIAVASAMNASFDGTQNHASITVTDLNLAAGLSSATLPLDDPAWMVFDVGLAALPGGQVLATHDDGSAAIVSGNDGRTMMIAYFNEALPAADGQQLYTNIFSELMRHRFQAGL